MPAESGVQPVQPTDATLKDYVAALKAVAAAVDRNTKQLVTAQKNGGSLRSSDGGSNARNASLAQARTALDYKAISQLLGRRGFSGFVVSARLERDQSAQILRIFGAPDEATTVAVHVDGVTEPEVLSFDSEGGVGRKAGRSDSNSDPGLTVTLGTSAGKNIARLELRDDQGVPLRLGPRLLALTT
jgi:hypothetical protein